MRRKLGIKRMVVAGAAAACALGKAVAAADGNAHVNGHKASATTGSTTTPIKHLVVIFQENVSFDHYFGTYPVRGEHVRAAVLRCRTSASVNGL